DRITSGPANDHLNLVDFPRFGHRKTDDQGEVLFDWLPKQLNYQGMVTFWHNGREYSRDRVEFKPEKHTAGVVEIVVRKLVTLSGTVVDANQRRQADASITIVGDGYGGDDFRTKVKTDADGVYSVNVDPHKIYLLVATSQDGTSMGGRDGLLVYPKRP